MQPEMRDTLAKTCAVSVGLTVAEVLAIARTGPLRYKVYEIDKRSGGKRVICQPSRELKVLQYFFLNEALASCEVHTAATAYKRGASIRDNAKRHARSRVILKLDFSDFFPSIRTSDWRSFAKKQFPEWSTADHVFAESVLFYGARSAQPKCLSIGAPTSPLISNVLMYKFDQEMSEYADVNGLVYTRYADDITISSREYLDQSSVQGAVIAGLRSLRSPRIYLNEKKTALFSKAHRRNVTGLIISNDGLVSLGRDRKRAISAMTYNFLNAKLPVEDRSKLRGLLAFALDAEPTFVLRLRRKYGTEAITRIVSGAA